MIKAKKLAPRKELFCREFVISLNGYDAAVKAGYSPTGAHSRSSHMLCEPGVIARIKELQKERVDRLNVDADYVLLRLYEIDNMDVLDILKDDMSFKNVSEWPPVWRRYLKGLDIAEMFEGRGDDREMVGILKKIKWPDKTKNLELLGKHINVQAFSEKLEVVQPSNVPQGLNDFYASIAKTNAESGAASVLDDESKE